MVVLFLLAPALSSSALQSFPIPRRELKGATAGNRAPVLPPPSAKPRGAALAVASDGETRAEAGVVFDELPFWHASMVLLRQRALSVVRSPFAPLITGAIAWNALPVLGSGEAVRLKNLLTEEVAQAMLFDLEGVVASVLTFALGTVAAQGVFALWQRQVDIRRSPLCAIAQDTPLRKSSSLLPCGPGACSRNFSC